MSNEAFDKVINEIVTLHDKKQSDYGKENDPFSNVRASEDFGIQGWVGAPFVQVLLVKFAVILAFSNPVLRVNPDGFAPEAP